MKVSSSIALALTAALGVSAYTDDFCAYKKRATLGDVGYVGNIGTPGHYACNLKLVDQGASENYQYLARLSNAASATQKCVCFLKIGPDGKSMNGFWSPNKAFDFELAPGETKYMVAQTDSQGGCTCGTGSSVPLTPIGQYAGTWFEFDFGDKSNSLWSGGDASSLVSHDYGLSFQGLSITSPGVTANADGGGVYEIRSIIYPNGDGCNAFPGGTNYANGFGFNLTPGAVRFNVQWGIGGTVNDCPDISVWGTKWRQPH